MRAFAVLNTITFDSLDVGRSVLHIRYVYMEYGLSSYMKVIESRSRSQEPERSNIPNSRNTELPLYKSRSIKHTTTKFAYSMGFTNMTCDWDWCRGNTDLDYIVMATNAIMMSSKMDAMILALSHIDDILLETTPDINQMLLQFIDVMNLVDLLLHFSRSTCMSSMMQVVVWYNRLCVGIRVKIWNFIIIIIIFTNGCIVPEG